MNLTCPTLAACVKYPNFGAIDKSRIETKKVGVFQSEKSYLHSIAAQCGLVVDGRIVRHPLCYLVEAADSICYLTMDLEDGFKNNLYSLDMLSEAIGQDFPQIYDILKEVIPDKAKITNIRNSLITKLVETAFHNFEIHIEEIEKGTYNQELIFADSPLANHLQIFCIEKIFSIESIYELEMLGSNVLRGLLDFFITSLFIKGKEYRKRALKLLSNSIVEVALKECEVTRFEELPDYYQLRVVLDHLSGMTDRYALKVFRKISGMN